MSSNVYESLGHFAIDLINLNGEYDRLLALLCQVISGEVAHERVSVNLVTRTWAVTPVMPAKQEDTANG